MKYIRLSDGRIVDTQDERGKLIGESVVKINNSLIVVRNNKGDELIPVEDIIKQADTIEELCDEFVVHNLGLFDEDLDNLLEQCKYLDKTKIKIFGATWTDKGLIYVAKMNEKGCLELL